MKKLLGIFCLILFTCVYGKEDSQLGKPVKEKQKVRAKQEVEIDRPKLECIFLARSKPIGINRTCRGVIFRGVKIPGEPKILEKKLQAFLGKTITEDLVTDIRQEIADYYKTQKRPFIAVRIPDQDITTGAIYFLVTEAKVGKIWIKEQKWTKEKDIRKRLRLEEDGPINVDILEQDLYWLNRNPFRQAYAIYTPGKERETTDVEIYIKDRLPIRLYLGMDNIGNAITGYNRMFTGLTCNLWRDQLLSYQYTIGSTLKKYQSHFLQYTIPFSWRHQLLLIGGYSRSRVHYTVDGFSQIFFSKGFNLQTSARYDIPLIFTSSLGEVILGFDFKRTNNNVEYSGTPAFGAYSNLTQFMMGYNMGGKKSWMDWNFEIEGFYSPFKWVADQTNAKYFTIRAFSKVKYAYLRSSSVVDFFMPYDFSLAMYLRGQLATENLLPSEMYGLGGFDTIRGYKEGAYNGDHALLHNIEMKSPSFSIFGEKDKGKWKVLAFFDIGMAWKNHKAPSERKSDILLSTGPGVRYNWLPYVTARLDWGFQLKTRRAYGETHNRGHFSVIIGF